MASYNPTLSANPSEPLLGMRNKEAQCLEYREGVWEHVAIDSNFTHRYYHATAMLNNHQIVIFGGSHKAEQDAVYKKDLWLFDVNTLSITPVKCSGAIPHERYGHTLTRISDTQMFLFGGDYNRMKQFSTPYLLEIRQRGAAGCKFRWKPLRASAPKGRFGHTANLIGRKIYFFAGWGGGRYRNDIIVYDLDRKKWTPLVLSGPIPETRYCHTATTVGKKIYVWGGNNGASDLKPKTSMWVFDTETFRWHEICASGEPPSRREGHVDVLYKNKIYFFGGHTETCRSNDLFCFDIQYNMWTKITPNGSLPLPRTGCRFECLNTDAVWMIAGSSGSQLKDIWKLDLRDYYKRNLGALSCDTQPVELLSQNGPVLANSVLVSARCPRLLSCGALPYSRKVVEYFISFVEKDELPNMHEIEFEEMLALLELTSLFPLSTT